MSTFSKANFKTLNYNSFRPHYPPSFYQILGNYVEKHDAGSASSALVAENQLPIVERAIDLGCGTGVATYPLLNLARDVIGLDLSPLMIETANSLIEKRLAELGIDANKSSITFKAGSVEDFVNKQGSGIEAESVDLITAAQCIHWFKDYDTFFESSAKLLKKGGTLAYFYYIDPMIVDFSGPSKLDVSTDLPSDSKIDSALRSRLSKNELLQKAYELYNKYAYDDPKLIGPYWEQPGRSILKHYCVEVNKKIPKKLYADVEIETFTASVETPTANSERDLDLKKLGISLQDYLNYFSTYSGFHNYKEKTGDETLLTKDFLNELIEITGWDLEKTKIDLVWNTGYTFLRKK